MNNETPERMTPAQQEVAARLTPAAIRIANVYGVDTGVALLALCVAVIRYAQRNEITVDQYALAVVRQACRKECQRERLRLARERPAGSLGSTAVAPTEGPISDSVLSKLPPVTREIATRKWVRGQTIRYIVRETGISYRAVLRYLKSAKSLIERGE